MIMDQERLEKIRTFAHRGRTLEKQYEEHPLSVEAIQLYNRRLDDTIRSLQDHIKRQEDALQQVTRRNPHNITYRQNLSGEMIANLSL